MITTCCQVRNTNRCPIPTIGTFIIAAWVDPNAKNKEMISNNNLFIFGLSIDPLLSNIFAIPALFMVHFNKYSITRIR